MTRRIFGYSAAAAAIAVVLWLLPTNAAAQRGGRGGVAPAVDNAPTPRDAAGHPDLTGLFGGGGGGGGDDAAGGDNDTGEIIVNLNARGGTPVNFERDNHLTRRMAANKPLYKPEYWEIIRRLNDDGSQEDPGYGCVIGGVPRIGPPQRIVQLPKQTIFFYGNNIFREIPTDGRKHSSNKDLEGTVMGEAIGTWDGDAFVVDSIGFSDFTWLDIPGYLHSENMHVVEKFTGSGNTVKYEVTVDDPMLLKPYVYNPRNMMVNAKADMLGEALPCIERDITHLVSKENH